MMLKEIYEAVTVVLCLNLNNKFLTTKEMYIIALPNWISDFLQCLNVMILCLKSEYRKKLS